MHTRNDYKKKSTVGWHNNCIRTHYHTGYSQIQLHSCICPSAVWKSAALYPATTYAVLYSVGSSGSGSSSARSSSLKVL